MKKLRIAVIAAALIIISVLIYFALKGMKKPPQEAKIFEPVTYVDVQAVHYYDYIAEVTAFGRLKAKNKIDVISEVNGILLKSSPPFDIGNKYEAGQTLIKIDNQDTELNLYAQKSDFLNLLTRLVPDIKSDFPASFDQWDKYLRDFDIKAPLENLPEIKSDKEKYFLASRNILKSYYSLKNLELLFSKYTIEAPFPGAVTEKLIDPGTLVRPGQKIGTFAGVYNYELELSVNSSDIQYIKPGDKAYLTSDETSGSWTGSINRISSVIDAGTQTVKVFVNVSSNELKDGMYLKAVINGSMIKQAFKIPRKALVNNKFIYIAKDSVLIREEVKIHKLSENDAFINNIDSLQLAVVEPLVNITLGSKVIPVHKKQYSE